MIRRLLPLLAGAALTACALEATGPHTGIVGLPAGLDVQLSVAPGEVAQRAPFTARLAVTNRSSDTVRVVTSHGCLVLPNVVRDGERVPFRGTDIGCTAAVTTHVFAPGETRTQSWNLKAELYAQHPGDVDGAAAPSGTYRVRAVFDTGVGGRPEDRPAAEATLRVR